MIKKNKGELWICDNCKKEVNFMPIPEEDKNTPAGWLILDECRIRKFMHLTEREFCSIDCLLASIKNYTNQIKMRYVFD